MTILFVVPFMPDPASGQAGHRLAFDNIRAASGNAQVHVLLVLKHPEEVPEPLTALCGRQGVHLAVVGRLSAALAWSREPTTYPRFITRYSLGVSRKLLELCVQHRFSAVRFEFSQTFRYAFDLRRQLPDANIAMSVHDLQFQVVLRQRSIERWFAYWAFRTEQRLLQCGDAVYVLCNKDRTLVNSVLDVGRGVHVVPPALSPFVSRLRRTPEEVEPCSLLFWGAMSRRENVDAVLHFHKHVFLPLREQGLPCKLYIVGSSPPTSIRALQGDAVTVTGFQEDPSPYFQRAAVGVVPLRMGAGIKLKTLELLAAGLPVVATPVGAEGVDDTAGRLWVRDLDRFAETLRQLL